MPELPEVETTRRGIEPYLQGARIEGLEVRESRLRWPIAADLSAKLCGQQIHQVGRRAKYLLIRLDDGALLLHLGMSGSLRVVPTATPPRPHDHVDLLLDSGHSLRLRDPRRFGSLLWSDHPNEHPLLRELGPEPLEPAFDGAYLYRISRSRKSAVKSMVMDAKVVVGVGNIYANEALFLAAIDPRRAAGRIAQSRYHRLVETIKQVLAEAIERGGTTLRDFSNEHGRPGFFQQSLQVYGRSGLPCPHCGEAIRQLRIAQRSSFFCVRCQH